MKNRAGFTLVEVLVALAIIAIALVAVIKVTGQSVRTTSAVKSKISAHWVAMNVIAEFQSGMIKTDRINQLDGVENMFQQGWYWHVDVLRDSVRKMTHISVTVRSTSDGPIIASLVGVV